MNRTDIIVIPAEAGIQFVPQSSNWAPACAGATGVFASPSFIMTTY